MSQLSLHKEIEIRGAALRLPITIEAVLMSIVYFSNAEQYKERKAKTLLLKGLMFSQKISRVREVLAEFHPDLLARYSTLFDDMEAFKKFRNKIAHCAFSWGDSISDFEVWEVEEDENKFQFYKPIKTTVEDTFGYILKTIKDIIPPLTNLLNEYKSTALNKRY